MKIYKVNEEYIEYLSRFDNKVAKNKQEKRPYIGIVLEIGFFNYFAPLTSPKLRHKTMKNQIDFIKINNGELGAINLNNMIPIPINELIVFNINNEEDTGYRNLLRNQYKFIRQNKENIKNKAYKLYAKVTNTNSFIKGRCVDFRLLETKSLEYNTYREVASTRTE